VIRISFGGSVLRNRAELDDKVRELMDINQQALGITCVQTDRACFAELIRQAHAKTGQRVVVLVDEYDQPCSTTSPSPRRHASCAMACATFTR
jgi:hypothetical protein